RSALRKLQTTDRGEELMVKLAELETHLAGVDRRRPHTCGEVSARLGPLSSWLLTPELLTLAGGGPGARTMGGSMVRAAEAVLGPWPGAGALRSDAAD
ncbi:hypothetical protein ACFL59_13215, partial [Planctomycetota bacterium]